MTSQFLAYDAAFRGGVNVAVGSFIGQYDIVTSPMSGGGPDVRVCPLSERLDASRTTRKRVPGLCGIVYRRRDD